jgi:DNA-binding NarL/FixJ family response regulator
VDTSLAQPIRIALVDDDVRYRRSLETLFTHDPSFAVAASFSRATDLLEAAARGEAERWDLVLMDLSLPLLNGIEATRRLKASVPELPVVVLTVFEEVGTLLDAIGAGADGYLLKKTAARELLSQLRAVTTGGAPLTPGVARTLLEVVRLHAGQPQGPAHDVGRLVLSEREQEILRGLVRGLTYKRIGEEFGISLDTVRAHVRSVYRKLQVHSVAQAVSRAIRERLV